MRFGISRFALDAEKKCGCCVSIRMNPVTNCGHFSAEAAACNRVYRPKFHNPKRGFPAFHTPLSQGRSNHILQHERWLRQIVSIERTRIETHEARDWCVRRRSSRPPAAHDVGRRYHGLLISWASLRDLVRRLAPGCICVHPAWSKGTPDRGKGFIWLA